MVKTIEIALPPTEAFQWEQVKKKAIKKSGLSPSKISKVILRKRSIDARGKNPLIRMRLDLYVEESYVPAPSYLSHFVERQKLKKKVIIVGAGPAGYFAALELLRKGLKPIVFDRGKDVQARRRDLRAIQQDGIVNPQSNYCFGEGGAGTYSDGKLYTRSGKRGSIQEVLKILVEHGAHPDILVDAHPHIGSNKLPKIVAAIRQSILKYGGEIHFNAQVTDLIIQNKKLIGVLVNDAEEHFADAHILATGHSARDIYYLLHRKGLRLEAKPFALGIRVEHSQIWLDERQYKQKPRDPQLPASSYSLSCQVDGKGVFSFCMCPGGMVVPAATAPGEIVTNGMSLSRRDSPFANAGLVTAVDDADFLPFGKQGMFAGLALQQSVEQAMFAYGDGSQKCPSLRVTDFVAAKLSKDLPDTSYIPGSYPAPLYDLLPNRIYQALRRGIILFDKRMKGFHSSEAVVLAPESRTSSPIRIPRNKETLMNDELPGLYPCGEGAGYAGGIMSAAIDGRNVARKVAMAVMK